MGSVNESIFSNDRITIPLADVQHIEKLKNGGLWVTTKHTKYAFERDIWENPIFITEEEAESFLKAWCSYRHELEIKDLVEEPNHTSLVMNVDCYQCGNILSIPFSPTFQIDSHQVAYAYCKECQEGVEIVSEEMTLSISRLQQE